MVQTSTKDNRASSSSLSNRLTMLSAFNNDLSAGYNYQQYITQHQRILHFLNSRTPPTVADDPAFEAMYQRSLARLDRESMQRPMLHNPTLQIPQPLTTTGCTCATCPTHGNPPIPPALIEGLNPALDTGSNAIPSSAELPIISSSVEPLIIPSSVEPPVIQPSIESPALPLADEQPPTTSGPAITVTANSENVQSNLNIPPPPYEAPPPFEFRPIGFVDPQERLPPYRRHAPFQPSITFLSWRTHASSPSEDSDSDMVNELGYETDPDMPGLASISDDEEEIDQLDSDDELPPDSSSCEGSNISDYEMDD
ncbi:hypothetical protein BJ165DRAFT_1407578 [Panaeolus papilionaceus]|nr:hypothetical protein BJ165DRAFT_1407578 [Panaeolus papilionaceus]